jgi:hypothetical protein
MHTLFKKLQLWQAEQVGMKTEASCVPLIAPATMCTDQERFEHWNQEISYKSISSNPDDYAKDL